MSSTPACSSSAPHCLTATGGGRRRVRLSFCPSALPQQSDLLLLFKFLMAKSTCPHTLGPSQLPNPEVWSPPPPQLEEVLPGSGLQQPLLGRPPQPTFITPHNEGPNLKSSLSQVQERSCSPAAWPTNADPGSIWVARFLAGSTVAVVTSVVMKQQWWVCVSRDYGAAIPD